MTSRLCIPWFAAAMLAAACGPPSVGDGPYRAQVIDLVDIDLATGEARFELGEREFQSLQSVNSLSTRHFQLRRGGTLSAREVAGSIVVDAEFSGADDPDLRYEVENGVIVALDYSTLAMLSATYQLDEVMHNLEQSIGVSADEIVADGRYDLLFEPVIKQTGAIDITTTIKFNAFYLPGARQFGLARRSRFESIPLASSRLVLAHEFGHALFEIAFHGGGEVTCDDGQANSDPFFPGRLDLEYATRGLNEGFADLISFANSGAIDVLSGAGVESEYRSLVGPGFFYGDYNTCDGEFYCIGTLFARSMFDAFVTDGGDPGDAASRGALGRDVFEAVSGTQAIMRTRAELPAPRPSVANCEVVDDASPALDGEIIGAYLAAFVDALTPERRASVCAQLIANFGDVAFPIENRDVCP